jgi:hypothetical protein
MWRKGWVLILTLALSPYGAGAQEGGKYSNRPLAEALTNLQAEGLRIVFSTAVVRPSMMIREEPHGDDPREILDQLLEPHGLRAEDSSGGTILIVPARTGSPEATPGSIRGIVTVGGERVRVVDLVIAVEGTGLQTTTLDNGRFVIDGVLPGRYTVSATSSAFTPQSIREVEVRPGRVSRLRFDLVPVSVFLSEVIVTPSHFRLLDERPESRQSFDREEVRQMPHVADTKAPGWPASTAPRQASSCRARSCWARGTTDVALDRAEHMAMDATAETEAGTFEDCLEVWETTPLAPDDLSIKVYAPGVGLVVDDVTELVGYTDPDS